MIDIKDVPRALHHLIPVAQLWGIGDDVERENRIGGETVEELERLIHCIDEVSDEDLFGWLQGQESYAASPSGAYVAFSCLMMAIDSAKLELKQRQRKLPRHF